MKSSYLQLQFLVLILAFTAILGRVISLPAPLLVLWRTLLAALIMLLWLYLSKKAPLSLGRLNNIRAIGIGVILGLHWTTFFGSIQLANISVCLAGMASTSFFTSLTEPLIDRRAPRLSEILLGLLVVPGLILIAGNAQHHTAGLGVALISAFLASLFPVLNRRLTLQGVSPQSITLYEMLGAMATCLLVAILTGNSIIGQLPTLSDWLWLLLLSGVCTVWAFSFHIHLLKKYTAFTTNLAINFEPVYGILLAAVIFHEHKELGPLFYLGATCILVANILHAIINRRHKQSDSAPGELPLD